MPRFTTETAKATSAPKISELAPAKNAALTTVSMANVNTTHDMCFAMSAGYVAG